MTPAFAAALAREGARLAAVRFAVLDGDAGTRARRYAWRAAGLSLNLARLHIDHPAWTALTDAARADGSIDAFAALVDGAWVNVSERRPALHTALRSEIGRGSASSELVAAAKATRARMRSLAAALCESNVAHVISIGIGGSDLGPRLVVDALGDQIAPRFDVRFLSNVDAHAAMRVLRGLDPARTAAIVVSKTFTTDETLRNAALIRSWMGAGADTRLYAVTAATERAVAAGIDGDRVLPMWDAIGGRYSLWSAVGFAIALALGDDAFDALLAGAAAIDAHTRDAPPAENLPLAHAMAWLWQRHARAHATVAVVPYDQRLALLPAYLQQLVMESLGKGVDSAGAPLAAPSAPVVWGGVGTDVQHSFFQSLHQGTEPVPVEFIAAATPAHGHIDAHRALLANLLAQSEALANGDPAADGARRYPGGRPSMLIAFARLDAYTLGALLATYEHSVYFQAHLLGINAFDQWGVELGKGIARNLLPALTDRGRRAGLDPISAAWIGEFERLGVR